MGEAQQEALRLRVTNEPFRWSWKTSLSVSLSLSILFCKMGVIIPVPLHR